MNTDHTNDTGPVSPTRPTPGRTAAVAVLVAVVIGIIAVAFRGSWGALRDAALACHVDRTSADLYPFAVDGLLIVAILAAVLLRHDRGARRYTLAIIAGYTGASWILNFLHGLGRFTTDPVTHRLPGPPWYVVVIVASLVIGSIFLGSHLLVYVWRHLFPDAEVFAANGPADHDGTDPDRDVPPVPEPPADAVEAGKVAYRHSLTPGMKALSQQALMDRFGLSKRQAVRVQSEVKAEQDSDQTANLPFDDTGVPVQYSPNGQFPGSA